MKALVINSQNDILFSVDVAEDVREIEVAGALTIDGAPVNRRTYRVTRSKANFARAARMEVDTLIRHSYNGLEFYTA